MKDDENKPMFSRSNPAFLYSPRCGAKTRKGTPCQCPAVRGKKRCRLHGGAKGSGAQPGNRNAVKHGFYTAEALAERKIVQQFLAEITETINSRGPYEQESDS